jgi:L-alanine-DL-glutamate epimerase-like enolase superfamily enzyme
MAGSPRAEGGQPLKITQVEVRRLRSPFPPVASRDETMRPVDLGSTLVRVHTETGLAGIGESWLVHSDEAALAEHVRGTLAPLLVGQDALDTERLWYLLWSVVKRMGFTKGLSAVDQALWDLKAKHAGLPLYQLLGGSFAGGVTAYATAPQRSATYAEDLPGLVAHGFRAVKLAIGRGVEEDLRVVEQAAARVGAAAGIAVDANGRYRLDEALRLSRALEPLGLLWFEEPLPHVDLGGLAALTRRAAIPVAGFQEEATIWRLREYLAADALSVYNVCLETCGGVSVARKAAAMCEAWRRAFVPHGFGPAVNFAATLHVAVAAPTCQWLEYPVPDPAADQPRRLHWAPHVRNAAEFSVDADGRLAPPERPGLGVELDEDALDELTVA